MVQSSDFAYLDDTFPRRHGHLTSSKVTSCNDNMRRHPSKCAISSKCADIVCYLHTCYLAFIPQF